MKIISKIILAVSAISVSSCSPVNHSFKRDDKPQIRIVDMQGNPRPVYMKTPTLNMKALQDQGNLTEDKINSQKANPNITEPVISKNKYSNAIYDQQDPILQNTAQMPQNPEIKNQVAEEDYEQNRAVAGVDTIPAKEKSQKEEMVEYDLGAEKPVAQVFEKGETNAKAHNKSAIKYKMVQASGAATAVSSTASETTAHSKAPKGKKKIFVQSGSFTTMQHANIQLEEVKKYAQNNPVSIQEAQNNGKTIYRVVVGPFATKQKASMMVEHLETSGHKSLIIKNK